ncbi:Serine/threonine-protein phosphatase 4 regulatory subunit 2 [Acromyrmex echinatior]|uniref:Serine/threonine-protein phosphatase 4 regulatory subunit 2 n=1 Tax=Acromyrmex echinatior TaxID=103372 RepID=F4W4Z6_ACREC|nr:Serine/threonine-protein phosphatase 4 regulatory subunit 2 [Acromyrmex echinatior]
MENLEEVLQALDEFQKMRPSVIPQELEDYLCWVAKTGDPVYQWPLIKTLVREKLTRVMTDFYESCPTLELAPCPNVEHFNYDIMKSNLLERLESFANAPFTVQRICELLTAPRKEYNRVDKFMRAIEKNILVVSTREPGPITRRGETGDGMVNGSVEEDAASVTQQPPPPSPSQPSLQPSSQTTQPQPAQPVQPTSQDVEMEYWEKDCSSTVTISVHTVENEQPLIHSSVIPASDSTLTKNLFAEETAREKIEQVTSRTDISATNYITTVSDFSTISNLNLQPHESVPEAIATAVPVVQSLPTVGAVSEDSMVPSTDIAVAIMNEDTNSQPNLDMETTVIPLTTDTTRKLQAAFQAKRFESGDNKSVDKSNEKTMDSSKLGNVEEKIGQSLKDEETTKSSPEHIDPNEMPHDESRLTESLLQTDVEMKSDTLTDDTESVEERARDKPKEEESSILEDLDEENLHITSNQNTNATTLVESQSMEKDSTVSSSECVSAVIVSSTETYKTEKSEIHSKEESETISSTECFARDQSISQKTESVEETDKVLKAIPTTASSSSNTNGQEEQESDDLNNDNLNIMEISNDKMVLVESMTSDPISSVEKSKEATSVIEKLDPVSPTVETIESSDNVSCRSPKDDKLTGDQDDNLANSQSNKATADITIKGNQSSVIESIACRKESEELMEIDDEESLSTFQQDEPMEQEAMEELPKS